MSRFLLTLIFCLALPLPGMAAETESPPARFVVITHPGVASEWITPGVLRSAFSMRLHLWPDGTPVEVVTYNGQHPDLEGFSQACLGIPGRILERIWTRNLYAGIGRVPYIVQNAQEMLDRVAHARGAIGYLSQSDLEQFAGEQIPAGVHVISGVCK